MKGHTCLQVQGDHLPFLLTDSCSVTVFVFKTLLTIVHGYKPVVKSQTMNIELLGGSGGFVNSLDFCLASLKSIGCFYFRGTMEGGDSEFANFTLPTLKAFLEARSHNVSGNKQ